MSNDYSWVFYLVFFSIIGSIFSLKLCTGSTQDRQMARLNKKLDLLLNHFQLQPHVQHVQEECRRLIASKGKIEAIKYYRETTGASLVEAKNEIDAL